MRYAHARWVILRREIVDQSSSLNSMETTLSRIFGSGKKGEPLSPQRAIQKLRETEEMLSKKSEFLEKRIEKELNAAKKHGMKNKRGNILKSHI